MKLTSPFDLSQFNLEYMGSPQFGPVLSGYGIIVVPQGSHALPFDATQVTIHEHPIFKHFLETKGNKGKTSTLSGLKYKIMLIFFVKVKEAN